MNSLGMTKKSREAIGPGEEVRLSEQAEKLGEDRSRLEHAVFA